jgi:hypothetical protein
MNSQDDPSLPSEFARTTRQTYSTRITTASQSNMKIFVAMLAQREEFNP